MEHLIPSLAFNWTKVELKLCWPFWYSKIRSTFNWTKVELKRVKYPESKSIVISFNWTKVELKPTYFYTGSAPCSLLIELR